MTWLFCLAFSGCPQWFYKNHCHLLWAQSFLDLSLENPKIRYSGQKLIKPVASRIIPSQPHTPITPVRASITKTAPTIKRNKRSTEPRLLFILFSLSISYTRFHGICANNLAMPQKPVKPANTKPAPTKAHNR